MLPIVVSPRELAVALAARLDAVAPPGLRVRAEGGQVSVYRGEHLLGGSAAPSILDVTSDERHVATAAYSTINGIQDVFAEELTEPWPAPAGAMPIPGTRVFDGVLHMWFGPTARPALALAPFDLPAG